MRCTRESSSSPSTKLTDKEATVFITPYLVTAGITTIDNLHAHLQTALRLEHAMIRPISPLGFDKPMRVLPTFQNMTAESCFR